jgi:hypothetical protein
MMKRTIWPIGAIVAIFALGFVVALAVTDRAEQQMVIRQQAAISSASAS